MKQTFKRRLFILVIAFVVISGFAACGSGSTDPMPEQTVQDQTAAESNPTSKEPAAKQTDIFDSFRQGENYKTSIRPKLLKDDWQPARKADETCAALNEICDDYPELGSGVSSEGFASFRWKKGDKIVNITGQVEEDPEGFHYYYVGHEFEKVSNKSDESQSTKPDFTGKYELSMVGISGEHILELMNDKTAAFINPAEDGTSEGEGSWKWDPMKKLLTVTLTIEYTPSGMEEGEKPEISKAIFQLEKEGKNLKIVSQTFAPDAPEYKGSLFRKL